MTTLQTVRPVAKIIQFRPGIQNAGRAGAGRSQAFQASLKGMLDDVVGLTDECQKTINAIGASLEGMRDSFKEAAEIADEAVEMVRRSTALLEQGLELAKTDPEAAAKLIAPQIEQLNVKPRPKARKRA